MNRAVWLQFMFISSAFKNKFLVCNKKLKGHQCELALNLELKFKIYV